MDDQTLRFIKGMKLRRKEWKAWCAKQSGKISRILESARNHAAKGRFLRARRTAWTAMMAIDEMDRVWQRMDLKENSILKTLPKGWRELAARMPAPV